MKALVHSDILKAAVSSVARYLMTTTTLEAYQCIRLEMTPTTLMFRCTNSSYSLGEATISHGNEDEESTGKVECHLRGEMFAKAVASSEGDVELEADDKFVHLRHKSGRYKIPVVDPSTIPEIPTIKPSTPMVCDSRVFKHALAVAAAVGEDCGITQDVDGSVILFGARGDSFVTISKLASPGVVELVPNCLFAGKSIALMTGGCIGDNLKITADERFVCIEAEEDGLHLKTLCARAAGKDLRPRLLRRMQLSHETVASSAGELANAFKRVAVVTMAESMLCDVDCLVDKIVLAIETSSGESVSECASKSLEGDWFGCVNSERAATMLRPFAQSEPVTLHRCSINGADVAIRFSQGNVEMFMAQGSRERV